MLNCGWYITATGRACHKQADSEVIMNREPIHVIVPLCNEHRKKYAQRRAAINQRSAENRTTNRH